MQGGAICKTMFYNQKIETMDRAQLRELQSERLVKIVKYTYDNVEFYRKRMDEAGVKPGDIKSIDDISKLPFMQKKDLRDYYPFGTFAAPLKDIVRFHASSGTTGKPIVAGYTQNDLDNWAEGVARCLTAYGATKEDILQVSYGYGLFTGGLGAHDGGQKVGSTVIPMSSGNTAKQIMLMKDLGSTGLCCTPSYALFLAESLAEDPNIDIEKDIKLKFCAFGAEPWTEEMRQKLESTLGIKAYDIYGLSEIAGPGVGYECEHQCGTHLSEDYFYPEILDPNTGEPLPEGTLGELTFTHLTKEGMPLLRYRTHDLTALHYEKCQCGRTLVRMDRILGRCDDMLIIRGVNVFPSQIEAVILSLPEFEPHFILTVDRVNNTDTSELKVEVKEEYFTDEMAQLVGLQKKLEAELRSVIGLGFKVKLVEPKSIERSTGKARRVFDNRKL